MKVQQLLLENRDEEYADFQLKLVPNVENLKVIGVRVPLLREIAKDYAKDEEHFEFLESLPHEYYDENMLHSILVSKIKDYDECVEVVEKFLPYVDNWAVCDTMRPKVFAKNKEKLLVNIRKWAASSHTYTCRFGIDMLMTFYLDGDFKPEYLNIPAAIVSEEYYVNMMIAWYFATALAKQWDATIPYIEEGRLSKWVHNKTIQKAVESYRITDEQKKYLRGLKK